MRRWLFSTLDDFMCALLLKRKLWAILVAVIGAPFTWSQNLTDQWVEKAAAPLIANRVADGLSVGYIEGTHYGIMHFGSGVQTNKKAETSVPGIYAAGDITGPPWQVAKAVGEGCVAGLEAAGYAKRPGTKPDGA